jgi:phospholipid/cholesterol/gamma-HCH transport system ATP-binding protein
METIAEIKGLQKSFDEHQVLKDISFSIKKGENVVILGRSGSGKSVLAKCMVGLIAPDKGHTALFGKEIGGMSDDELNHLRKKIGFLFQGGALYDSMSVRENLAFPMRRHKSDPELDVEERIREALESVGLPDAIDKMPGELSGGMRKRIGLARSIILNPELIFYDEPTTGLDAQTAKEISLMMLDVQKLYKASSLIITHDLKCVKITSNRILVLENGVFIAEGSYDELAASKDKKVSVFFE